MEKETLKQKLAKKLADIAMQEIKKVETESLYENECWEISNYFEKELLKLNGYN